MTDNQTYHQQPPSMWSLYRRVIIPKTACSNQDVLQDTPALTISLMGTRTNQNKLQAYRSTCQFDEHRWLPVTWPHILAFPLHLRLLTDPQFHLPLLGLVHLRNRIEQKRAILEGELLDITCSLGKQRSTDRGLEFDIVTEAFSAGQSIWTETSTTLYRTPTKTSNGASPTKTTSTKRFITHYAASQPIHIDESQGRRYGRVSGDLNPIHLHALSARLFGFKQAIAHGMWSKARCLALLEQAGISLNRALSVTVNFKRPLLLPGEAILEWQQRDNRIDFQLLDARGETPHLSGEILFKP